MIARPPSGTPVRWQFGKWDVECLPNDGGRLTALRYSGCNLLTAAPTPFKIPAKPYGRYELRPVYGYDDCFPSVDECNFPGPQWKIPDHGELCWVPWTVNAEQNSLRFQCKSEILPLKFERRMSFDESSIDWTFEVSNRGLLDFPFLHVMHALMPLQDITHIKIPEFASAYDEINKRELTFRSRDDVTQLLLRLTEGTTAMLILRGIKTGELCIGFNSGVKLEISFPVSFHPSLGIWWNNGGYPDEEGCRRTECAFEPIPARYSSLAASFADGRYLTAPAESSISWRVSWRIIGIE